MKYFIKTERHLTMSLDNSSEGHICLFINMYFYIQTLGLTILKCEYMHLLLVIGEWLMIYMNAIKNKLFQMMKQIVAMKNILYNLVHRTKINSIFQTRTISQKIFILNIKVLEMFPHHIISFLMVHGHIWSW